MAEIVSLAAKLASLAKSDFIGKKYTAFWTYWGLYNYSM